MAPVVEELKQELQGKLKVEFVDVGQNPAYAEKYNVMAIPTQILFDASGKQIGHHEGAMTKAETMAFLHKLGLDTGR
jgi:thioredoxin 1